MTPHSFPEDRLSVRGPYFFNTENDLVSAVFRAFGSSERDILLVPVLDMVEDEGLENSAFIIFWTKRV